MSEVLLDRVTLPAQLGLRFLVLGERL